MVRSKSRDAVWLITEAERVGRYIADGSAGRGDSVIAGARRTEELAPLVTSTANG